MFVWIVRDNPIGRATEPPKPALDSGARTGIVVGPNIITLVSGIRVKRAGIPVYQEIRVDMEIHPLRGSMRNHVPMDPAEIRVILDSQINFPVAIGATCN